MYNIQIGLLRIYMYANIRIYIYIVGTHRLLYPYGYGMDVIIFPGKKECFVFIPGNGERCFNLLSIMDASG